MAEPAAEINGGAGAIITIPEDTTNTPYLLQPTGASVDGILKSIQQKVDAIDELSHLTAIKAKKGPQSGISLQVEKEMLKNPGFLREFQIFLYVSAFSRYLQEKVIILVSSYECSGLVNFILIISMKIHHCFK